MLPGTKWRPLNFIITTVMFIYLSNQVAHATGALVTTICGQKPKPAALPVATSEMMETTASASANHDTPNNSRRWVDRLADGPASSPRQQSFSKLWQKPAEFSYVRGLTIVGVMWALNLLWPKA